MPTPDKFSEWVKEFGVHQLVAHLQCHQVTIENWMRRKYIPNAFTMKKLVKLSKGAISYADIIDPFCAAHPEEKEG